MWPFQVVEKKPENIYAVSVLVKLHIPGKSPGDAKVDTSHLLTFLRTGEHSGRQIIGHEVQECDLLINNEEEA